MIGLVAWPQNQQQTVTVVSCSKICYKALVEQKSCNIVLSLQGFKSQILGLVILHANHYLIQHPHLISVTVICNVLHMVQDSFKTARPLVSIPFGAFTHSKSVQTNSDLLYNSILYINHAWLNCIQYLRRRKNIFDVWMSNSCKCL